MWQLTHTQPKSSAPGHPHRPAVVLRPHRGRQAVLDAVGPADRLVLVGEALDGDDRAEDLVLAHLVVLLQAADDGRLPEVAALALPRAAGQHVGVVGQPAEHAADALELVGVVQRAVEDVVVVRRAGLGVAGLLGQRLGEVVGDPRPDEHAGGGGAVLPGVEVAGDRDVLGGVGEVGVVEDDRPAPCRRARGACA